MYMYMNTLKFQENLSSKLYEYVNSNLISGNIHLRDGSVQLYLQNCVRITIFMHMVSSKMKTACKMFFLRPDGTR